MSPCDEEEPSKSICKWTRCTSSMVLESYISTVRDFQTCCQRCCCKQLLNSGLVLTLQRGAELSLRKLTNSSCKPGYMRSRACACARGCVCEREKFKLYVCTQCEQVRTQAFSTPSDGLKRSNEMGRLSNWQYSSVLPSM